MRLEKLSKLWKSQVLSAKQRQNIALKVSNLLLKEPVGTRVRLGNTVLERIPRSLSATLSPPTEDGHIRRTSAPAYVQFTGDAMIDMGVDVDGIFPPWIYRGYVEWDVSPIPNGATITDTVFKYEGNQNQIDCHIHAMGFQPTARTAQQIYDDIGDGDVYADPAGFPVVAANQQVDLGATADSDLQDNLSVDWFAIGIQCDDEASAITVLTYIISEDGAANPKPTLYVEYQTAPPEIRREIDRWIGRKP